jgi:hypothetical protein
MNSPELLLLVENCPKGAETLVTRCLHSLTDKGALDLAFPLASLQAFPTPCSWPWRSELPSLAQFLSTAGWCLLHIRIQGPIFPASPSGCSHSSSPCHPNSDLLLILPQCHPPQSW